jgi:hypothetical protein
MKTYDLYVQRTLKITIIALLVVFVLIAAVSMSGVIKDRKGDGLPWFMGVFFLAVAGFNAYYWVLRIPHRITVTDDGHIEFISIVRQKHLAARDIRSITPDAGQIGFLTIGTDQGKIRILNQFDEFHEFIAWLKTQNPAVELAAVDQVTVCGW